MGRRDAARYSKEGWRSVCVVLSIVGFAGCKCAESNPAAQRTEDLAKLPQGAGSLQDQLAAEAAGRPTGTPTLEALTAAVKDSVSVGMPRQVLGQKMLASYCASVDSSDGMLVTICEYPSPEQAKRGETESNLLFSKLVGHQSRVNKKSVLHLVARSDTPPEHVAKVLSAFEGL
jgi:hypothetical protein